jgi:hypothetical protein
MGLLFPDTYKGGQLIRTSPIKASLKYGIFFSTSFPAKINEICTIQNVYILGVLNPFTPTSSLILSSVLLIKTLV